MLLDRFLIGDFINSLKFRRKNVLKIGWVVPGVKTYNSAMASTRIRCYDVIIYLNNSGFYSGLYKSFIGYDIVIFQKAFMPAHIRLAKILRNQSVKIVFDINVNYVTDNVHESSQVLNRQTEDIKEMLNVVDYVFVPTKYLFDVYKKFNNNIFVIEESIPEYFFYTQKKHNTKNRNINLLYCGYAIKASELLLIRDVLDGLRREFGVNLVTICERDPRLPSIKYKYIKYNIWNLPSLMAECDISIAPRNLELEYNLGHAFTKIGYPMSIGLPVVASPIPSYIDSPAVLCSNQDQWYYELKRLILQPDIRECLGRKGKEYTLRNFSMNIIGGKYVNILKNISIQ